MAIINLHWQKKISERLNIDIDLDSKKDIVYLQNCKLFHYQIVKYTQFSYSWNIFFIVKVQFVYTCQPLANGEVCGKLAANLLVRRNTVSRVCQKSPLMATLWRTFGDFALKSPKYEVVRRKFARNFSLKNCLPKVRQKLFIKKLFAESSPETLSKNNCSPKVRQKLLLKKKMFAKLTDLQTVYYTAQKIRQIAVGLDQIVLVIELG